MAGYSAGGLAVRIIVLIIIIVVLLFGGAVLFSRLGGMHFNEGLVAGVSRMIGIGSSPKDANDASLMDRERLNKDAETIKAREAELDRRMQADQMESARLAQKAEELAEREKLLTDKENALKNSTQSYDSKEQNLLKNAEYLTSMPPEQAKDILLGMQDQDMIAVLRATDRAAQQAGSVSMVSTWIQMMPADRASTIMRKMASRGSDGSQE